MIKTNELTDSSRGCPESVPSRPCRRHPISRRILSLLAMLGLVAVPQAARGQSETFTEPYCLAEVAAPESGVVQQIFVREGQQVRRGESLATLDDAVLRATLEVARAEATATAQRDGAQAEVRLRKTRFEKLSSLRQQGHATQEELDRSQADYDIAEAQFRAAKEDLLRRQLEVKQIEAQLHRRQVLSPLDGVVIELHKVSGEAVTANDSQVATVAQLDRLRAQFYLSTETAASLTEGQSVPLAFPEIGTTGEGRVEFISPITDANSGTVRVDVVVDNAKGSYRSGVRCLFLK